VERKRWLLDHEAEQPSRLNLKAKTGSQRLSFENIFGTTIKSQGR